MAVSCCFHTKLVITTDRAPAPGLILAGASRAAGWVWMDQGATIDFPGKSNIPKWNCHLLPRAIMDLLIICGSKTMPFSGFSHEKTWMFVPKKIGVGIEPSPHSQRNPHLEIWNESFLPTTMWGPRKRAKLVQITPISLWFMVRK